MRIVERVIIKSVDRGSWDHKNISLPLPKAHSLYDHSPIPSSCRVFVSSIWSWRALIVTISRCMWSRDHLIMGSFDHKIVWSWRWLITRSTDQIALMIVTTMSTDRINGLREFRNGVFVLFEKRTDWMREVE